MDAPEVEAFLIHLAVQGKVAASTQNQALNAVVFLYRQVLKKELGWLEGVERAKKPARLPVVFTREEARAVLALLDGIRWVMATAPDCGSWRAPGCASRTWTSTNANSSSGTGREARTASPCSRIG
jgi:Phage integrase, N-terminal SAM-like domain